MKRMQQDNWVNRLRSMSVDGRGIRGQPKKTWDEAVKSGHRVLGLDREAAKDHAAWKTSIR